MVTKKRESTSDPEAFDELLKAMAGLDFGNWERSSVLAALAPLGWRETPDALSLTRASGETATLVEQSSSEGLNLVAFRCKVGSSAQAGDAASWIERARRALGVAPVIMGGPGPFIRWRRAGLDARDPGTSIGLRLRDGALYLELMATLRYEHAEYKVFEWGEGVDDVPYRWMGFRRDDSLHGMTTLGRGVHDWDAVERAVALMLQTLRDDQLALAGYGLLFRVQLRPRDKSRREVTALVSRARELSLLSSFAEPKYRLSDATMRALGWQRIFHRGRWRSQLPPATDKICREAARTMVGTLRAWKVELPVSRTSTSPTLAYRASESYGDVDGQDENIALLPLEDIQLAGIGLQEL
jgi:hypothetical protein